MSWKTVVVEEAISLGKELLNQHFGRQAGSIQHRDGGLFISAMGNGKMMSAYWHPTQMHSATCIHDGSKVVQRAESEPGYWAVAIAGTPLFGAQCKYNLW